MPEKNKDLEKKPDLWSGPWPEKKEDLKESFSNLKNELNELKSNIKEWQEDKKDSQTLDKLDKEISNIDKTIEAEKTLEKKTWWEGKIATKKEYKIAKQINDWLLTNPWEANQIRAESALKLLEDIHWQLDTNRIAKGAQWIMQKLTKNS
jgi:hypothetical protein